MKNWRGRAVRLIGFFLSLLALFYVFDAVGHHVESIQQIVPRPFGWTLVFIALLLYMIQYTASAWVWRVILRQWALDVRFRILLPIIMLAQIGKYLPGNVAHHVGRVELARRCGVPVKLGLASLVIEAALAIMAGLVVVIVAAFVKVEMVSQAFEASDMLRGLNASDIIVVASAVAAVGLALVLLSQRVAIWKTRYLPSAVLQGGGSGPLLLYGCAALIGNFVLMGITFFCVGQALHGDAWNGLLAVAIGAFAIAWLAGFVTPGSPAGLGVRDALLVSILTPVVGGAAAVGATLYMRGVTTVGDGLVFLLGWVLRVEEKSDLAD